MQSVETPLKKQTAKENKFENMKKGETLQRGSPEDKGDPADAALGHGSGAVVPGGEHGGGFA